MLPKSSTTNRSPHPTARRGCGTPKATRWRSLAVLEGHQARVWSAQLSPDGERILTASGDGTARLW
ncbi:WD40 repeat domain-containing protein [Baaleninema simplex]|uniref:WD40 repeat domain-containing protein n=1 Tax=Baaleninema simplex TaxID=2862350 RepID=UPI0008FBE506|nr:WD40 repeat domain-containing protein [Baaleninema simplex]